MEIEEYGSSISFRFDGAQLSCNHVQGFNDFACLLLTLLVGFLFSSTSASQQLFLFRKDFELCGYVLDSHGELVNHTGQLVDFGSGFLDLIGGEIDTSIVPSNFSRTVSLISCMVHIGVLLLEY